MTDVAEKAWTCPRDGTEMAQMGRRAGAWRCPACQGVFLDVEAMRHRRRERMPAWAPIVMSVVMSVVTTAVVRRILRHPKA